jgi:stage II sporulation protein P
MCRIITTILCIPILLLNILFKPFDYIQTNNNNIEYNERLIKEHYILSSDISLTPEDLPFNKYIKKDLSLNTTTNKNNPKILIFHTHSQEKYNNKTENASSTVISIGDALKRQLEDNYDVCIFHCKETFDMVNGKLERENCYHRLQPIIGNILNDNTYIEVLIDIQRDGLPPNQFDTIMINNRPTAKLLFINGISKKLIDGKMTKVDTLPNPYVEDNLAFSYQMKLKTDELYPGLVKNIVIKPYRYSLHMAPKSLLIEIGNNNNTIEEALNAVAPLAETLAEVLCLNSKN